MRRSPSTSLPSPAHRQRQEGAAGHVHSPGGKCSTDRFPPGAAGDPHRKQQLVQPHRLGRRSAPPESTSESPESNGTSVIEQFASSHFQTNYQLVWSDEFNGTSVDASKWNKVGPWGKPVASAWSGHFSYNRWSVSVANGLATITAQKSGRNWTGGILSTDTTKRFQYGFVEVRAKLPKGQGFWPAIWLYGANSSADELDMMEFLGGDASTVYQTYHFSGGQHQVSPKSSDWTADYHLFQMKWEPGRLTYYIDNVQTGSWTASVPARPMCIMLNFDVGDGASPWGGYPHSSTPTTAQFNVDYVRVYQQS
jgi:beta-glucanase (GH16 family)